MEKVIVFGAGNFGKRYIEECGRDVKIVAVCDNIVRGGILGQEVRSPNIISSFDFDIVVIAIDEHSINGAKIINSIYNQLRNLGIDESKILLMSRDIGNDVKIEYPRVEFLRKIVIGFRKNNINGAIAECGVCFGDFASHINVCFPQENLYLFDTFSGFDERDFIQEKGNGEYLREVHEILATANPTFVKWKCRHKENIIIKQGYIPDTFEDIDDEFCFVNLDMDLYAPTLAALRFFVPRMKRGGVILVHDYYSPYFDCVSIAVDEYLSEHYLPSMPIGDSRSIALLL